MKEKKTIRRAVTGTTRQMKDMMVDALGTDEILWENEIRANFMVGRILLVSAVLMFMSYVMNELGLYAIDRELMLKSTIISEIMLLAPYIICKIVKGERKYLKIFMLIGLVVAYALVDMTLGHNVVLLMTIPTVISSRYYKRALTVFVSVISTVAFFLSYWFNCQFGTIDLNHVKYSSKVVLIINDSLKNAIYRMGFQPSLYREEAIMRGFIPKYSMFIIIAIVAAEIAHAGYRMLVRQNAVAKEHARIDTELDVAKNIQEHALPIVHDLKEHPSYDLAATMEPAKEIGGDFYDFMMLDDTHLALVIADVSGKGVPAAMLMMVSKLLLDNALSDRKKSPGLVLAEVNHQLCEKSLDDMFVTVWLGIIDLTTGTVVSANGGHEYPLICRKNGKFEIFKDKHGLVIGAMDGMRYPECTIRLEPGDTLFVYTDGVSEANNESNELFTLGRTCVALDEFRDQNMIQMLHGLRGKINEFAGSAEQFDDITMVGFRLNSLIKETGLTLEPTRESTLQMQEYLEGIMEEAEVSPKLMMKMNVAIDELYSNIVSYSQAGWVQGICEVTEETVTVILRDNGIPYNPLDQDDPDITLAAEDREVGGLGIFMTRKLMDEFTYAYEDGINISKLVLNR